MKNADKYEFVKYALSDEEKLSLLGLLGAGGVGAMGLKGAIDAPKGYGTEGFFRGSDKGVGLIGGGLAGSALGAGLGGGAGMAFGDENLAKQLASLGLLGGGALGGFLGYKQRKAVQGMPNWGPEEEQPV
jgi:hypothetical protein